MSAGTPYIGSKINLISKAEIRYQGTLYQVDTKEATVTLAKVRSFGTEKRPVPKHIPPRNETYEFIIFRGSDIKDLNVIDVPSQTEPEETAPQDPAIVSATHAPQQHIPPPASQPSASTHPRPPTYTPFPPPNIYSPFGMPYVRPPVMMGARGAPHPPPPIHPSQGHPAHAVPIPQQPSGGPFSHEPIQIHPPRPDESQQSRAPGTSVSIPPPQVQSLAMAAQPPLISGTSSTVAEVPSLPETTPAPSSNETEPQASSTPVVPGLVTAETTPKASLPLESESPGIPIVTRAQPSMPVGDQQVPPSTSQQGSSREHQPQVDSTTQQEEESGVRSKRSEAPRGERRGRNQNNRQQDGRSGYRGYNRRGGFRGNYRGPPRGRGGYHSNQHRGPPRGGSGANGPVYRYESEFDFESANARFKKEAFEEEFKQLQVDDRSETRSRRTSDTTEEPEAHPTDRTEEGVVSSEVQSDNDEESIEDEFYDKSKSFFDSISCDSSGPNRRPDRHAERDLNTETFGVSNVRGYNRYHGRGRGRGRGYYGSRGGNRSYRGSNGKYGNRRSRGYTEKSKPTSDKQD